MKSELTAHTIAPNAVAAIVSIAYSNGIDCNAFIVQHPAGSLVVALFSALTKRTRRSARSSTMDERGRLSSRGRMEDGVALVRGGVFVGVNHTGGGLPTLKAAAAGAQMMYDWAVDPDRGGMDAANVHVINDADGKKVVTPDEITAAVDAAIRNGVDQLILYFSGHGLLVDLKETWLLTEAPKKGNAAISVSASIDYATLGRTPHVVIISDACRTPAREIVPQRITAVSAFPNEEMSPRKRVDVFYASAPGQAALELDTVSAQGIFTSILHDALNGILHEAGGKERYVLEPGLEGDSFCYIWSGPLGQYLEVAVGEQLYELNINRDQVPWAVVEWYRQEDLRWLARVPADIGVADQPELRRWGVDGVRASPRNIRTLTEIADGIVTTIAEQPDEIPFELERASHARAPGANDFIQSIRSLAQPFPDASDEFPIRVRGTQVAMLSPGPWVAPPPDGTASRPRNVVVVFSNETVTVLPVLPGYVTEVSVRGKQIVAVWFERVKAFATEAESEQLRQLRAIVTASVQRGRFRLADNGLKVARGLQRYKGDDPSFAVYAAYSYYELRELDRLRRMDMALSKQLHGSTLFDVGLLSYSLSRESRESMQRARAVPFFPMLSQGWELLDRPANRQRFGYSFEYADMSRLDRLKSLMLPSLWTVFDWRAREELMDITWQDLRKQEKKHD